MIAALLLLSWFNSAAQTDTIPLKINLEKKFDNDSLWLTVTVNAYKKPSSLMFTASLKNSPLTDTFFLPVIDSVSLFCLIFPAHINDDLLLRGYFSPGIFTVTGQVNSHRRDSAVKAILITDNKKLFNKEIVVNASGQFSLPPLVFENKASLAFNYINSTRSKNHPDITLSEYPFSLHFNDLIFSEEVKRSPAAANSKSNNADDTTSTKQNPTAANSNYKTLNEIKLKTKAKTNIEKFDETYSTALFKDAGERIIDCLDNDNILAYTDCMSFLQTRVPGLSVNPGRYGDMVVKWHGKEISIFYIDEIQVDLEQLLGVNTADIAMIKVYSPPFFGAIGNGDGGAVAVYTRRGEYRRPDANGNKWLFTIKGYSPPVRVLFQKEVK